MNAPESHRPERSEPQPPGRNHRSDELQIGRATFRVGLGLAAVEIGALAVIWLTEPGLFTRILAVIGAAFVGGRMPGILTGLELGLGSLATTLINILVNTCWLLIALPLFQHATRSAGGSRMVRRYLRGTERRARQQTSRVSRFGLLGLALFVWLPFPATGAFVGAVIGLVMGVPTGRLVVLLLGSMWMGVVTWTYGIELVFLLTGTTGRIVAWTVTAAFLIWGAVVQWRRSPASADR